jgi:hypothetical protein
MDLAAEYILGIIMDSIAREVECHVIAFYQLG